jgi:hypothetical protein
VIDIGPLGSDGHWLAVDLLVSAFAKDQGMQALLGRDTAGLAQWFGATLKLLQEPVGGCIAAHKGSRL